MAELDPTLAYWQRRLLHLPWELQNGRWILGGAGCDMCTGVVAPGHGTCTPSPSTLREAEEVGLLYREFQDGWVYILTYQGTIAAGRAAIVHELRWVPTTESCAPDAAFRAVPRVLEEETTYPGRLRDHERAWDAQRGREDRGTGR